MTTNDLISRQDAINAVCANCLRQDLEVLDGCLGEDCSIKPILESLPSADRPTGEWIPVSEALPGKGQVVLDIDDKETWGDKGTWDVDKQRGW